MRRHLIFLLIAVACSKTKDEAKPVTPAPAGSGSVAENPPPKPAGGDYDGHMKTGTTLEDQKKWSDALVEFEAALVAKPDDARALTEVGFTAYLAGKLDRAKEASLAAVLAAKDDKLRGAALFNLGLAVEKTLPNAAASLFIASLAIRPNAAVRARAAKLLDSKQAATSTPEGDALLAKVNVKASSTLPSAKPSATPVDQAMMAALEGAGVEWSSGAGKSVLLVENLECRQNNQAKPATYECTTPPAKGKPAQAIIENLNARKVAPTKEHGDVVTYKVASVRCRSFNEGDSGEPDECVVN